MLIIGSQERGPHKILLFLIGPDKKPKLELQYRSTPPQKELQYRSTPPQKELERLKSKEISISGPRDFNLGVGVTGHPRISGFV